MQALLKDEPAHTVQRLGVWQDKITGCYRPISTHQIAMAWWLYQAKHITKRQLRIYFAAHEMHERRRYTKPDPDSRGGGRRRPQYTIDEVMALIGARGSTTAEAAVSADIKALGKLGLVKIMPHAIELAVSIDQVAVEDLSGFWVFFNQLPNPRRKVPVPRRTLRALAGGFQSSVTGVMLGLMIRCLYWHKKQGGYRVDGRTKASWFVEVFMLGSERSVTVARARLVELGWLGELESEQWQLNRYGKHEQIITDAFGPIQPAKSASPNAETPAKSATPCLNNSSFSSRNLKTRRPAPERSGPPDGSRKRKPADLGEPRLSNVTGEDLRDNHRLLKLHRQAVERGDPVAGEAGRLDFFALAERARAGGHNPPKLFAWLLKNRHFDRIAIADEEAAARRLRELHNGRREQGGGVPATPRPAPVVLTEDDKVVLACLQTAQKHRGVEAFTLARQVKGWPRERWDLALAAYRQKEHARWGG